MGRRKTLKVGDLFEGIDLEKTKKKKEKIKKFLPLAKTRINGIVFIANGQLQIFYLDDSLELIEPSIPIQDLQYRNMIDTEMSFVHSFQLQGKRLIIKEILRIQVLKNNKPFKILDLIKTGRFWYYIITVLEDYYKDELQGGMVLSDDEPLPFNYENTLD